MLSTHFFDFTHLVSFFVCLKGKSDYLAKRKLSGYCYVLVRLPIKSTR